MVVKNYAMDFFRNCDGLINAVSALKAMGEISYELATEIIGTISEIQQKVYPIIKDKY